MGDLDAVGDEARHLPPKLRVRQGLRAHRRAEAEHVVRAPAADVGRHGEEEVPDEPPAAEPADEGAAAGRAAVLGGPGDAVVAVLLEDVVVEGLAGAGVRVAEELDADVARDAAGALLAVEVVELHPLRRGSRCAMANGAVDAGGVRRSAALESWADGRRVAREKVNGSESSADRGCGE